MPLFDFKCLDCGKRFEALVLKDPAACPRCRSRRLEQLLSLFGVSSKGTRETNLIAVRRKNTKTQKEKRIAQVEYERAQQH